MTFTKTIRGKIEGIVIKLELSDDTPDVEKIQMIRELQHFVNRFDSIEQFHELMEYAASNFEEERTDS